MGKLLQEGKLEYKGRTIHYRWYRNGRLPHGRGYQCYIEAYVGDRKAMIYDHGYGLDHAISLLKMEVEIQMNKEKAKMET